MNILLKKMLILKRAFGVFSTGDGFDVEAYQLKWANQKKSSSGWIIAEKSQENQTKTIDNNQSNVRISTAWK